MINYKYITIQKNRGWRGLAEVVLDEDDPTSTNRLHSIFSFSEDMWRDLLAGHIVVEDDVYLYVIEFNDTHELPKPTQQRSVLIKNFVGTILSIEAYPKNTSIMSIPPQHRNLIAHFRNNNNRHTTSEWNCVGVRVIPFI